MIEKLTQIAGAIIGAIIAIVAVVLGLAVAVATAIALVEVTGTVSEVGPGCLLVPFLGATILKGWTGYRQMSSQLVEVRESGAGDPPGLWLGGKRHGSIRAIVYGAHGLTVFSEDASTIVAAAVGLKEDVGEQWEAALHRAAENIAGGVHGVYVIVVVETVDHQWVLGPEDGPEDEPQLEVEVEGEPDFSDLDLP